VVSDFPKYGPHGLRVAVVDASVLALARPPSNETVRNASYDWRLKFPLLLDQDAHLARHLGVEELPTTFLISADGHILHRWRGLARPTVLALAIEELLGGPFAHTP
jgi:peroxiredoxin